MLALPSKVWAGEVTCEFRAQDLPSGQEEHALGVPLDQEECGADLGEPTVWSRYS